MFSVYSGTHNSLIKAERIINIYKYDLVQNSLDGSTPQNVGSSNLETAIKQKTLRLNMSPAEV